MLHVPLLGFIMRTSWTGIWDVQLSCPKYRPSLTGYDGTNAIPLVTDRESYPLWLSVLLLHGWSTNNPLTSPPRSNGLIGGYVREWVGWPATIQKDTKDIHGRSSHDAGDNLSSFSTLKLCHRTLFVGSRNRPSLKAASASLCGWKDGDV